MLPVWLLKKEKKDCPRWRVALEDEVPLNGNSDFLPAVYWGPWNVGLKIDGKRSLNLRSQDLSRK